MTDYQAEMQQYVYGPDTYADGAKLDQLRDLVQHPLDPAELGKLSNCDTDRVYQFGYLVGRADIGATMLRDVAGAQGRVFKIPRFQDGYINGILLNDAASAVGRICEVVAGGQMIYNFNLNCTRGVQLTEELLGKLTEALLKCGDMSQCTAQSKCFLFYDKSKTPLPRFIRDVLLAYPVTRYVPESLWQWKNLADRYIRENPSDHEIISKVIEHAIEHARGHRKDNSECPDVLNTALEANPSMTWNVILSHVDGKASHVKTFLWRREGLLDNEAALSAIQEWVNKNKQRRSELMARILPNDLNTMVKWMSVCTAKDKPSVVSWLRDNLISDSISQPYEKHYKDRITEVEKAKSDTSNRWVLALLTGYESCLYSSIAEVLRFESCEYLGIGYDETPDEKAYRDGLREWLYAHKNIPHMDKLIQKFDTALNGNRRHDGNIWHAELVRLFHEDGTFTVEAAESDKEEKQIAIDIKLLDKDNPDDIINIQAWHGMTGMGHHLRRFTNTGKHHPYKFDWEEENKKLKKKIDKLPMQGQNFLIQKADQTALKYLTSYELLPDHVCILQVYDCGTHVYYKPSFKYKETVVRLAKILGKPYKIMEGDWSKKSDWLDRMYLRGQNEKC
ncbi:MAG: hypothetical protein F4W68_00005 [Cenarchaeum sp. SB0661_bin_35]|nr:hypothetical protein [Cenarchaeum sp. SB0661_bin_35]